MKRHILGNTEPRPQKSNLMEQIAEVFIEIQSKGKTKTHKSHLQLP